MGLMLSACRKTDSAADVPTNKTNYQALSKQIALNFYNAVNGGSTGFKANKTGDLRTNSTGPQCGDVVTTPTNWVQTSGDTTSVTNGNRVFTYICNNNILNEYSLADTVSTQVTTTGFKSVYSAAQRYNTRAIDYEYTKSVSTGVISCGYTQRKFNSSNITTDSLNWATHYTLQGVYISHVDNEAVITGGMTTFTSATYHKDIVNDVNGWSEQHHGVISFEGDDTIKVAFMTSSYTGMYLVNIKTGVATKL